MRYFWLVLSILVVFGCGDEPGEPLRAAIAAADKDDIAAFERQLDKPSRDLFERIRSEKDVLKGSSSWVFMRGKPHRILKGAKIENIESVSSVSARATLKGSSDLDEVWLLKGKKGWAVHLVGALPVTNMLRMAND